MNTNERRFPGLNEESRQVALANAVWNYLGINNATEFAEWYGKLRETAAAIQAKYPEENFFRLK